MAFRRFCRLAVFLAAGGLAFASNFSFSGTSLTDDQQVIFTFTAGGSNVTLRTWSYAGGTNINGQSIAPGGFDPDSVPLRTGQHASGFDSRTNRRRHE